MKSLWNVYVACDIPKVIHIADINKSHERTILYTVILELSACLSH